MEEKEIRKKELAAMLAWVYSAGFKQPQLFPVKEDKENKEAIRFRKLINKEAKKRNIKPLELIDYLVDHKEELIKLLKDTSLKIFPIKGCEIMQTPRSSFYYKPAGNKISDTDLADKINEIALEFPSYGYRRVTAALAREGIVVNHKKVYRIMKSENILCRIRRSFKKTTNSSHGLSRYPNLIKEIIPSRVNEIWHADITYIRLRTLFAYLAALIDGYSRKVVGYALGRTLSAELTVQAILDALSNRNISGELTHHSDQGLQYCSQEYINILKENNIKISMSERANPYDNAKMESFFRTIKVEEVYMFEYDSFEEALQSITHFIEEVYNCKRLHSSLGYMPPEEFEYNFNNKIRTRQLVLT